MPLNKMFPIGWQETGVTKPEETLVLMRRPKSGEPTVIWELPVPPTLELAARISIQGQLQPAGTAAKEMAAAAPAQLPSPVAIKKRRK